MKSIDTLAADIRYLRESHDEFRSETKTELKEIRIQTQKTNGRVSKAEENIQDLQDRNTRTDNTNNNLVDRFLAPVITGLVIAGALAVARFFFGM